MTEEQAAEEVALVAADAVLAQRLAQEEAGDAGVVGDLVELQQTALMAFQSDVASSSAGVALSSRSLGRSR